MTLGFDWQCWNRGSCKVEAVNFIFRFNFVGDRIPMGNSFGIFRRSKVQLYWCCSCFGLLHVFIIFDEIFELNLNFCTSFTFFSERDLIFFSRKRLFNSQQQQRPVTSLPTSMPIIFPINCREQSQHGLVFSIIFLRYNPEL